ncbi:MAG: hypothetical protein NTX25_13305 [Proteobacteria bacterium]|nr:hypothetical protein [Pseudomonadota bacterium]
MDDQTLKKAKQTFYEILADAMAGAMAMQREKELIERAEIEDFEQRNAHYIEALRRGREEGREEGRKIALQVMVQNMLAKGLDHQQIASITQLSLDELRELL